MTIFRWLNKQGVESSNGFVLQSMHRHYYHYIEAGKVLRVIVEPCRDHKSGEYYEEISINPFTWDPPNDSRAILPQEQALILENIAAALRFMGIKHVFVGAGPAAGA